MSKEAMKLALEALEDYVEEYGPHQKDSGVACAITAIREALGEQPACEHEWLRGVCLKCGQSIEQPAQQEPVEKNWRHVIPGMRRTDQWDSARVADYNKGWNDCQKKTKAALEKLYTSPAASKPEDK